MVHKRAIRKQQDTSRASRQPKPLEAWLAHLRPIADAFNGAVAQCVEDADADAVHRVRTGSRRLQARLEVMLRETGAAGKGLERPARAWLRQLQRIRRAAGPVRDLDVHRKLLENWLERNAPDQDATGADGKEPPVPAAAETGGEASLLRSQAERLDTWLKGERKHLAHGMQKEFSKRQQALAERQSALFAAAGSIHPRRSRPARPAGAVALENFMRAADAMPLLHAENLHDFRKLTKKARYVAELGGEEQGSSSVATALKRIQDAIGDWHDWLCLVEEARAVLGQNAPELTASFEREVERHFTAAMTTTQNMRGQLAGEWMADRGSKALRQSPKRQPAPAVAGGHHHLASSF